PPGGASAEEEPGLEQVASAPAAAGARAGRPPPPAPRARRERDEPPILAAHNRFRARHCAPPLAWSPALARQAQQWADTLAPRSPAAHTGFRARHCAPPLAWSPARARQAQQWADTLASRGCAFEHDPSTPHGENLAFAAPAGARTGADIARMWYREIAKYDF